MDPDLRQLIDSREYRGFTGEAAVEEAYQRISERYDQPRNESDLIMTLINSNGFKSLFEMYFALHPEEAQQIVDEHNARFTGLRGWLEPFAYFCNPVRGARYEAARRQLEEHKE